jgi:hypothetical protein
MAKVSRSMRLFRKAEAALMAAVEVYNKPDFRYREETFVILALNAWELMLKARLLAENGNNPRCLYQYERRETRSGSRSQRKHLKKNRSGNIVTIRLGQVMVELDRTAATRLPVAVKNNVYALAEVRDNAVHYVNASFGLAKQVLEIGTASVRNFIELAKRWFGLDLTEYSLYLMPIGFLSSSTIANAVNVSPDEARLMEHLSALVREGDADSGDDFHVALEINLSFKRCATDAAVSVAITNDPNAPKVNVSEEDIRKQYPWDYNELTTRCRDRYSDFKQNHRYHQIRRQLQSDERYMKSRYLDPENPKSPKKDFYNANVLAELDKHYTRRR